MSLISVYSRWFTHLTEPPMKKTILLIGTLDTKGKEFAFVRDCIIERGHSVIVMDAGVMADPAFPPTISAEEVAEAGGASIKLLREKGDRGFAMDVMIAGVSELTLEWFEKGRFDGVLGLGGGGGTNIATAAMRQLPVGVPKVMVSTLASSDVSHYVDVKDITMMYSVVDVAGINGISQRIFSNAVGAICGMIEQQKPADSGRPVIAATMFGVTTPCVTEVRNRLEAEGFEVLIFHATGTGGRAMEGLIDDGYIAGVLDITTTEWCDELVGGVLSAGPNRLEAAGRVGIPQVVSCGALDMVNFHAEHTIPDTFKGRTFYRHNPTVTLMRTTPDECNQLGEIIAQKLNDARGPVSVFLPLKGVSMIDAEGQPFYDPEANAALFGALQDHVMPHVNVQSFDLHINDPDFALALADKMLGYLRES